MYYILSFSPSFFLYITTKIMKIFILNFSGQAPLARVKLLLLLLGEEMYSCASVISSLIVVVNKGG